MKQYQVNRVDESLDALQKVTDHLIANVKPGDDHMSRVVDALEFMTEAIVALREILAESPMALPMPHYDRYKYMGNKG